jgi:DNA-3-methyladenine glycosylase
VGSYAGVEGWPLKTPGMQRSSRDVVVTVPREFFERPVLEVAPDLLGCLVVHDSAGGRVVVRLTEVEAYNGAADPGSHAFRGQTSRNAVMFGRAGHVYVYFTYGMHWCMNLVCGPVGVASAVLLRAGQVVEGVQLAKARRPAARRDAELARGPARLTMALGVDGSRNGVDACDPASALRIRPGDPVSSALVHSGPRIGLTLATERPWRFWLAGEPSVSAFRPGQPRAPRRRSSGTLEAVHTGTGEQT